MEDMESSGHELLVDNRAMATLIVDLNGSNRALEEGNGGLLRAKTVVDQELLSLQTALKVCLPHIIE